MTAPAERARFVRANTRIHAVPLCPEIELRVADEAVALWQASEAELGEHGLPLPFWAFAWAGGQALARYLLDNRDRVRGRRVLDIGCGSGLVAIAAALAGAKAVLAADVDSWAIVAARINAELNRVHIETLEEDILDRAPSGHEVVLVGDLFYDREVAPRLLAYIERAVDAGCTVLIGDPGRTYLPKEGLTRMSDYGVPTTRDLEDSEIKRTSVWRLEPA